MTRLDHHGWTAAEGGAVRDLWTGRDPAVAEGRPFHWICAVAWVNERQHGERQQGLRA